MLFVQRVAQAHHGAALHLAFDAHRVDRTACVGRRDEASHLDETGLGVHLDLGELRGPAERLVGVALRGERVDVLRGDVLPAPADAALAMLVHLVHDPHHRDRPVAGPGAIAPSPARPRDRRGRHAQHARRHLDEPRLDVQAGVAHRLALDEGGAAARGRPRVRRAARVGVHHADVAHRHAKLGADDLREQRLDALAEVADARVERRRAVLGDLDVSRADVRTVEAVSDAVEHRADAEAAFLHGVDHSRPFARPCSPDAHQRRPDAGAFVDDLSGGGGQSRLEAVDQAELERRHAERAREHVHLRLVRDGDLQHAEPAHRAPGQVVRGDGVGVDLDVGHEVRPGGMDTGLLDDVHPQRHDTVRCRRRCSPPPPSDDRRDRAPDL